MECTETDRVLTRETVDSLGRERIDTLTLNHAKQQKLLLPDQVRMEDIHKVVDLYGWPWDVVRGILDLTRREIGEWVEKDVVSDIVAEATSAAESGAYNDLKSFYAEANRAQSDAFSELKNLYADANKWTRNLTIGILSFCATIAAAVIAAVVAYVWNLD